MTKDAREVVYWAIPWCIIGMMTMWSSFDQRVAIDRNTAGVSRNSERITAHEAVVIVEAKDRFTHTNFQEWLHAFMEANPSLVSPPVDFSPPPPSMAIEQQ